MKNLVVGYVQAPDRKKSEVLNLISKILDFSPSEIQQVHVCVCVCVCVCDRRCVPLKGADSQERRRRRRVAGWTVGS